MRIVIIGAPGTGKTTLGRKLAAELGYPLTSTDDTMAMPWSEHSAHIAAVILTPGPYVVEGVAAVRALRKALDATERPCDRVIYLTHPHADKGAKAAAFGKGIATVWGGIWHRLHAAGVEVLT